jgi:predicted aspartyl protease
MSSEEVAQHAMKLYEAGIRKTVEIDFILDTNFTGSLCLPSEAIAVLGLTFQYEIIANIANNGNIFLKVYMATILWNDEEQDGNAIEVTVIEAGRKPLAGIALMSGGDVFALLPDTSI